MTKKKIDRYQVFRDLFAGKIGPTKAASMLGSRPKVMTKIRNTHYPGVHKLTVAEKILKYAELNARGDIQPSAMEIAAKLDIGVNVVRTTMSTLRSEGRWRWRRPTASVAPAKRARPPERFRGLSRMDQFYAALVEVANKYGDNVARIEEASALIGLGLDSACGYRRTLRAQGRWKFDD